MFFSKIYLDDYLLSDLLKIGFKEGSIIISEYCIDNEILLNNYDVLTFLTLFEKFDSSSYYSGDWSFFLKNKLIDKNPRFLNNKPKEYEKLCITKNLTKENYQIYISLNKIARKIMLFNKDYIIYYFLKMHPEFNNNSKYKLNSNDMHQYYNKLLEYNFVYDYAGCSHTDLYFMEPFYSYLVILKQDLINGLIISNKYHITYANSLLYNYSINKINPIDKVDELYCFFDTNLKDEIQILPSPTCLDEVLEIRDNPNMQRFRSILIEWSDLLVKGEKIAENKIRQDIAKANKELKWIKKIKKFRESPINFIINSVVSFVPIASNILTVFNGIEYIYSNIVNKKYGWIMLNSRISK